MMPLRSGLRTDRPPGAGLLGWCLGVIGTLVGGAQPVVAQTPAAGVLDGDATEFRRRFQALLLDVPTRDLEAGWELARTLGPVAAPLLWDLHAGERSNAERRSIVLFAAMLAGGPLEDERAFAALDKATQLPDRLTTCMAWALGPTRAREQPGFWTRVPGRRAEPVDLLLVAALLASARFPGAPAAAPPLRSEDPGVVAAAAFAGVPVPAAVMDRFWRLEDPPPHAPLVWRGVLLGGLLRPDAAPERDSTLMARARAVYELSPQRAGRQRHAAEFLPDARAAAALVLGRADAMQPDGVRPQAQLLQLLAAGPRSAASLQPWLHPDPQPLDEEATRPRLAVEYVFSRDLATVFADRASWSEAAAIRRHVAVALAIRLLAAAAPTPVEWQVQDLPEWFFVRWASGAKAAKERRIDDAALEQAAQLAADGRLPRDVARDQLEQALWRWGSHPGLGLWEAERRLVRDLLLTGSQPGTKYQASVPPRDRYLANGLGTEDAFFEVAVAAYDFLSRPTLPIPRECRLR